MSQPEEHISDEELISAYYDGELSGDELARAEQLLATRPECRQWLDELRGLSAKLHEVPAPRVDEAFGARVLRRAEREMLSAKQPEPAELAAPSAPAPRTLRLPPRLRRPLAYAAVTAAAAAVLLIARVDEVAHKAPVVAQNRTAAPMDAEISALPADETVKAKADTGFAPDKRGMAAAKGADDRAPATPLARKPAAKPQAAVLAQPEPSMLVREPQPGATTPATAAAGPQPSKPDAASLAGGGSTAPLSSSLGQMRRDNDVRDALRQLGLAELSEQAAQEAAAVEGTNGSAPVTNGLVVVDCRLAETEPADRVFRQVLADNNIVLTPESTESLAAVKQTTRGESQLSLAPAAKNVELYLVVAPPEQLGSAVAELKSQTALFGNVQVVEQGQSSKDFYFRALGEEARGAAPALTASGERATVSAAADGPSAGTAGRKNAAPPRAAGMPKAPAAAEPKTAAALEDKLGDSLNEREKTVANEPAGGQQAGEKAKDKAKGGDGQHKPGMAQRLRVLAEGEPAQADRLGKNTYGIEPAGTTASSSAPASSATPAPVSAYAPATPALEAAPDQRNEVRDLSHGATSYQRALFILRPAEAAKAESKAAK